MGVIGMSRVLVTGGTKDDAVPIGVFVMNIARTNAHLFDKVIVFHDGISLKTQNLIRSFFPTEFIEYSYDKKTRNDEVLSYFSKMVFCKYECFKLLDIYDVVVWSDYDVVVLKPLDEFCSIDDKTMNVLTSSDSLRKMLFKNLVNEEIEKQFDLDKEGVCTPLFAFDRSIGNYMKIYEWCYQKTYEWDEDLYLPEQCVFSFAVQYFDIPLKRYSFDEYACFPTKARGDEYILHAYGPKKFWSGLDNPLWTQMYKDWLKAGGMSYKSWKKKLLRTWLFVKTRICGIRGKEKG